MRLPNFLLKFYFLFVITLSQFFQYFIDINLKNLIYLANLNVHIFVIFNFLNILILFLIHLKLFISF